MIKVQHQYFHSIWHDCTLGEWHNKIPSVKKRIIPILHGMILTEKIKSELNNLWFVFGNGGKKHTFGNHRIIQDLLEKKAGVDVKTQFDADSKFFSKSHNINFRVTDECIETIKQLFKNEILS